MADALQESVMQSHGCTPMLSLFTPAAENSASLLASADVGFASIVISIAAGSETRSRRTTACVSIVKQFDSGTKSHPQRV
jgi:hypothetical protein